MQSFPFKQTETVSFKEPLLTHIELHYHESPEPFSRDASLLDKLRLEASQPDVHSSSLSALLKYHAQLTLAVAPKFPIDEEHIQIFFPWYNAIGKDKRLNSSYNLSFEQSGVLFNIASLYSQLALTENHSSEDGLKKAALYCQQAAGTLEHLLEQLKDWGVTEKGRSQLESLQSLCLAQAQNLFVDKAIQGKMKDGTIAKLASAAMGFYAHAKKEAAEGEEFEKDYLAFCELKTAHLHGLMLLYRGKELFAGGEYGKQIGCYKAAQEVLKEALDSKLAKHASLPVQQSLKILLQNVESALPALVKDNDIVYMQVVPKPDALDAVGPVSMAKSIAFPSSIDLMGMLGGPLLFEKLVPYAIQEAIIEYQKRVSKTVKEIDTKTADAMSLGSKILISLNLPGSIEALEQPLGLPASLLQKSEEVRREGGAESITSLSETLSALRDADLRLLNEAIQILDEEERQDTEMRNHLKNRWTRPPSAQLNKNLREAGDSFKEKLVLAQKSDSMIQRKLEDHLPSIDALGSNRADLEASIPASSPASSIGGKDPIVKAMRALLNELGGLQSSFKETMDQAKKLAKEDSILLPLTEALSRNSNFDPEPMYSQGLRKYEPLTNQLNKLRQGQDVVLQSIHETYKKLSGSIHTSRSISEREHALSTLDAGYRFFKEIQANVTEGVKFYNDFQNVLSKFHGNCKDFAFARDIDRKDGLARVQEEMANMRINPGGSSPQQGYAMPQYEYGHANSPRPSGPVPGVWNPNAPQQPPFNPTYNYSASRRPQ